MTLASFPADLPNVWGEGLIFGFSGIDGPTRTATGFVATAGQDAYDLVLHTPLKRRLEVRPPTRGSVRAATGDVLVVDLPNGALVLTWLAWHTLVGRAPAGTDIRLGFVDQELQASPGALVTTLDGKGADAVNLLHKGDRFVVAYGTDGKEAGGRCEAGLEVDLDATVRARLAFLAAHAPPRDAKAPHLWAKCVSVMKVNALAPEGAFARCWSTPDRVPHQHMWLWDSAFHALGMSRLDPALGQEFLLAVLDTAHAEGEQAGMISHCMQVDGTLSAITQPPVLAWALWENLEAGGDPSVLREVLPALEGYLAWDLAHRDANQNGLLEWYIEGNPLCRSGESGLDNSPRFDRAATVDAVDFSVLAAHDMACLAKLFERTGAVAKAATWRERSQAMSRAVHERLWDEEDGFYYDRFLDGGLTGVRAVTGFLPLLLDDLPAERVERLVAMLHSDHFATACPVPSIATTDEAFSTDMWRGATWINLNFLVTLGLEQHGRTADAGRLRASTVSMVDKYYQEYGVVFEFYDARDEVPPPACARKGPPDGEPYLLGKMNAIRDYHWTAALTLYLLRGS